MSRPPVRDKLDDFLASFENPEISAMAQICRILEALPDEPSRMRVMHWSFGKFSGEFKRPVPAPVMDAAPAVPSPNAVSNPSPVLVKSRSAEARADTVADITSQVAELKDLFGRR